MSRRSFFFHYNKPATQQAGKVTLSFHYKGVCHLVSNVICNVSTAGRIRGTAPRFVMAGKAAEVIFEKDQVVIN